MVVAVALLLTSCYKDDSNYDYTDPEAIKISGIDDFYEGASLTDELHIEPKVEASDPEADLTYWWGVYPKDKTARLDTIAKTKGLDWTIGKDAKEWVLVFCATNKRTGYRKTVESILNIKSNNMFSRGWYILKSASDSTDLDFFTTKEKSIKPNITFHDVYSSVNGHKLAGQAGRLRFKQSYNPGNGGKRSLFTTSTKDMGVIDLNTGKELNRYEDLFYGDAPKPVKASSIPFISRYGDLLTVNNGIMYGLAGNTAKFSIPFFRNPNREPYQLSSYYYINNNVTACFFDEISGSFLLANTISSRLDNPVELNSPIPTTGLKKDLLFMGVRWDGSSDADPSEGIVFFRDQADPSRYQIGSLKRLFNYYLNLELKEVEAGAKIRNAQHFGLTVNEESMIYFSIDNQVWSRNLANEKEELQATLPAGEKVTFIRHLKYENPFPFETPYTFNYILIGSTTNGKYRVRAFTKPSGNLSAQPDFVMDGNGDVADVIYISPFMNDMTYSINH